MVKKPASVPGKVPKKVMVKTSASAVEESAIERAGRTITALEAFLAKWDSSPNKPDSMFPEVVKIRRFCELLRGWRKEAVGARGKGDEKAMVRRLRDFIVLCRLYS
jgi:hypothetical protein